MTTRLFRSMPDLRLMLIGVASDLGDELAHRTLDHPENP